MPKNVTSIFNSLFSKSRSGKLVTDAAPLPDNDVDEVLVASPRSQATANHSAQIPSVNHNGNSNPGSSSVSTELTKYESDINGASEFAVMPHQANNSPIPLTNSVAVNNTQAHNVYQFSQINGLHIGTVYNIANTLDKPTVDKRPKSGEPIRKTKSIDAMMKSTEELTHKSMNIVATHLGEGWRDVMRHLGFSDGQIEQMYEDNHAKGIKEVIYQFLLDYSRNEDDASLGHISRVLWKCGHRECVYILKEHWKSGGTGNSTTAASDEYVKIF